jgi:hypothetical protein
MLENSSQAKIVKYLTLALVVAALVILIKEVILKPKELTPLKISSPSQKVEIDLKLLKNRQLEEFFPFEKIAPPQEIGRENPFSPY